MTVLIANANKSIFEEIDSKLKFIQQTANTCTFNVSPKKFEKIRNEIRARGFNPFLIMYW